MKCTKCGKETKLNVCPSCGTKLIKVELNDNDIKKNNSTYEITLTVIAIIGIIIMYAYRAWLGGPIFLIAAYLAFVLLKEQYNSKKMNSVADYIKYVFKEETITRKIVCAVVMIAPVILVIATYRWIVVDTQRMVDSMFSNIY